MGVASLSKREAIYIKAQAALEADLLTTGHVSALFGVNFKTVLRWAKSGRLVGSRLPGSRGDFRFRKTDVLEFANLNKLPLNLPCKTDKSLVLVVDDDPLVAKSIGRILHGICHSISATDGYQAGILMALRSPTLVFLDLQMSGVDGISLLRYMRSVTELRSIPVCLITGSDGVHVEEAMNAGANLVLHKPFSIDQIRAAAAQMIHHNSKRAAA